MPATVDPAIKEEQVRATITLKDGRTVEKFIEHAVGSVERPMSDARSGGEVHRPGRRRAAGAAGAPLMDLCWKVESLPSAADIAATARVA